MIEIELMRLTLILLFWLTGFIFLWRIPVLQKAEKPVFLPSDVSLIIPARNEEAALERLLRSVREQPHIPAEIIVVDDQSDDGTAEVARRKGATVVPSADLPPSWVGKTWACWQGARQATGEVFVFLDADTFLEPEGLTKLISSLRADELVSVQPFHVMERCYERLSAIFNVIVMSSVNAFSIFASAVKPAGAFGPCIICRKDVYFAVGGHERVRGEILEHFALGKEFIREGRPVRLYGGKGALSFRMYPEGFASLFAGFARSFATGAGSMSILSLIPVVCWIVGAFGVTRYLVLSALLGDTADLLLWAALDLAYVCQIHWMLTRIGNFGFMTALLFQLPLVFFGVTFCWSLFITFLKKQVRWKGRLVERDKKEDRG